MATNRQLVYKSGYIRPSYPQYQSPNDNLAYKSEADGKFEIPVVLSGQPEGIISVHYLHANRASTSNMHFMDVGELADSIGASATGVAKSTVTFYRAVIGLAGGGEIYAANILAQSEAGHAGQVTGLEINVNIDPTGSTAGNGPGEFLVDPTKKANGGLRIIGVTHKPLAYIIGANFLGKINPRMRAYAGISFHNGSIEGPLLDFDIDATHVIRSLGNKTTGIDLSGDIYSSTFALYLKAGHKIGWASTPAVAIREAGGNIVHDGTTLCDGVIGPLTDNTRSNGTQGLRWSDIFATQIRPGPGGPIWTSGVGSPEGIITAPIGSLFTRTDGGAVTTLYVKESGVGNIGWVAK